MHLDSNGLIVQSNGDGGDTAQRTGFYYSALCLRERYLPPHNDPVPLSSDELNKEADFVKAISLLTPNEKLVRYPEPGNSSPPWNDPKDCSRDQYRPMIICAGLYGLSGYLKILTDNVNWFRYPNGDVSGPDDWGTQSRAHNEKPWWISDVWLDGAVTVRNNQAAKNPDDVGDDLNLLAQLAQGYFVKPSMTSINALRKYLKNRPTNYGVTKLGEKSNVMGALAWYFRAESGGNPEIAEAWRPVVAFLEFALLIR